MSQSLADRCIWLTRPAGQNTAWSQVLESAGAEVRAEPLLTIEPTHDSDVATQALHRADTADIVIASSVNAVEHAWRLYPDFAPVGHLIAVGAATAETLERASGRSVEYPSQFDAESLLALPAVTGVANQRITILAGEGGRTVLRDTLVERGAVVEKIATYRRVERHLSPLTVSSLADWADSVVVTSSDALAQFCRMLSAAGVERGSLPALWVPAERTKKRLDTRLYTATECRVLPAMQAEAVAAALANSGVGH